VWIGKPFVRARAGNGLPLALFLDTANAGSVIAQALAGAAGFRGGRYGEMEVAGAGGTRRGIRGCRPARGWRAGTVRRTAGPIPAGVASAGVHRRHTRKRCIDKRSRGDRFPGGRVLHLGHAMTTRPSWTMPLTRRLTAATAAEGPDRPFNQRVARRGFARHSLMVGSSERQSALLSWFRTFLDPLTTRRLSSAHLSDLSEPRSRRW